MWRHGGVETFLRRRLRLEFTTTVRTRRHQVLAVASCGGFRRTRNGPGAPTVVLYSHSLEATLAAVKAAGGRIVKDIFSFPGGRRFQFEDPSGNELAVWSDG
jgi:predicted enzyme related to lactoylglutathione lyase